jgi:phosphoserine phosphatase
MSFSAICFDCDSTLTTLEGIDELAVRAGCADQIIPLTTAAMDGSLTIDQVYARRLELIRPDARALSWVGQRYIETVVAGAREVIADLMARGTSVHVVSGGLLQPVQALALALGVPADRVHAVAVTLDEQGSYVGFDTASPLATSGGKAAICRELAARYGPIALVGDGVTDLEAREAGAFVIGFGGVVRRAAVVAGADVFVAGPSLYDVMPHLLAHRGQ